MFENKWQKAAVFIGLTGLLCFGILFLTNSAYPDLLFRMLLPLGLLLVFLSIPLLILSWIFSVRRELTQKNYMIACIWIVSGILWVSIALPKFLT